MALTVVPVNREVLPGGLVVLQKKISWVCYDLKYIAQYEMVLYWLAPWIFTKNISCFVYKTTDVTNQVS